MTYLPSGVGRAMAKAVKRNNNEPLLDAAQTAFYCKRRWQDGDSVEIERRGNVAASLVCDGETVSLIVAGTGWQSIPYRVGFRLNGNDWKLSASVSVASFHQWQQRNRQAKEAA